MQVRPHILMAVLAVVAAGCGGSEKKSPEGVGKASGEQPASLRQRMHTHFVKLSEAKSAVIEGKLADAKSAAARVWPEQSNGELPDGWAPFIESIKGSIGLLEGATEIETAAQAVSAIGRACGDCHQSLGLQTLGPESTKAPPAESMGDYMRLHQWASDRMWEGLVGPSDEAWKVGAEALATPLSADKVPEEVLVKPGMESLVRRIGQLSQAAAEPNLPAPTRQRIYGEFLGSCARCHQSFLENTD
jgi:mono/diheme cytochrome c family protein